MGGKHWKAAGNMKTMKKKNIGMQHSPSSSYSGWHAYVWANNNPSVKTFWKDSLLRGSNSSFTSQKGTAAETGSYCMLRNFLFASTHCFIFLFQQAKYPQAPEGKVGITRWASFSTPSSNIASVPHFLLVHLFSEVSSYHQVKKGLLLWKLCV